MTTFLPAEKGMTIRQPSTANLMLDSVDGTLGASTSANFQITRNQALLNGFFTRLGVTEVVLEWNEPNVSSNLGRNSVVITMNGTPTTLTLPTGFYTVQTALQAIVALANAIPAFGRTLTVTGASGIAQITSSTNTDVFSFGGALGTLLGIEGPSVGGVLTTVAGQQDLRPYRYLDFVSQQLTYNQDLKDASTAQVVRDVLVRWYMAWDEQPLLDGFGFPILMSYTPFAARRLFNPPKQIRWDNIQPVGNLSFQVYPNYGTAIANLSPETQWLMTIQASEC